MVAEKYQVRFDGFEGPLELLVELIEKDKLSINEISLSKVADEYISHLEKMEHFPKEEVAGFLVVAATLMLIKSRSLLPGMELTEEEEESIEDLEKRLELYREIRKRAITIKDFLRRGRLFPRESFVEIESEFIEPNGLSMEELHLSLKRLLEILPVPFEIPEAAVEKIISLEDKIKEIIERVEERLEFNFRDMAKKGTARAEVIVNFLAVLELAKRGLVIIEQETHFGDISVIKS